MAKAPTPHIHIFDRDTLKTVSLGATLTVIAFMTVAPFLSLIPLGETLMKFVAENITLPLMLYVIIETFETGSRRTNDMGGFAADNGLAILGFNWGILMFDWLHKTLTHDQWVIVVYCTIVMGADFCVGVYIALRIAFSPKEREEDLPRA